MLSETYGKVKSYPPVRFIRTACTILDDGLYMLNVGVFVCCKAALLLVFIHISAVIYAVIISYV